MEAKTEGNDLSDRIDIKYLIFEWFVDDHIINILIIKRVVKRMSFLRNVFMQSFNSSYPFYGMFGCSMFTLN